MGMLMTSGAFGPAPNVISTSMAAADCSMGEDVLGPGREAHKHHACLNGTEKK